MNDFDAGFHSNMGKKSKKAKAAVVEAEPGMPRHVRRETLEIINVLLESKSQITCPCINLIDKTCRILWTYGTSYICLTLMISECSCPFGSQGQTEWADFMDVYELVEKLRKKQQSMWMHIESCSILK